MKLNAYERKENALQLENYELSFGEYLILTPFFFRNDPEMYVIFIILVFPSTNGLTYFHQENLIVSSYTIVRFKHVRVKCTSTWYLLSIYGMLLKTKITLLVFFMENTQNTKKKSNFIKRMAAINASLKHQINKNIVKKMFLFN